MPLSDRFFTGNQDDNQGPIFRAINWQINSLALSELNDGANGGVNGGVNNFVRERIIEIVFLVISEEGLNTLGIVVKQNHSIRTTERYLKLANGCSRPLHNRKMPHPNKTQLGNPH